MKTPSMRCIEAERGQPLQEILQERIERGDTWDEIAFELGVTRLTLRDWVRRMGGEVETRRTLRFKREEAGIR